MLFCVFQFLLYLLALIFGYCLATGNVCNVVFFAGVISMRFLKMPARFFKWIGSLL